MPESVDARHRLLAEVTALRERDRLSGTAQFLRQCLRRDVTRRRIPALNPQRLHVSGVCGGETFRSEPAAQGGAGAGCRLHEKGFRAEPVDANNHHVNVAEPSSRVIARARWGRAAQSLLEPRPRMRARDRAARIIGRSIMEGHALANVIVLKVVAERGRDLRVAVDPQAIGGP